MNDWRSIVLSSADIASGKGLKLQNSVDDLFSRYNWPSDAALMTRDVGLDTEFLFSPGAARVANEIFMLYATTHCAAPKRGDVGLLLGHDGSKEVPFAPDDDTP